MWKANRGASSPERRNCLKIYVDFAKPYVVMLKTYSIRSWGKPPNPDLSQVTPV